MYPVDDLDSVLKVHTAPWPDVGAPLPVIVADDSNLLLAYVVSVQSKSKYTSQPREVSPRSSGLPIAIVKFLFPRSHMFGSPNDEAFTGHPLASRGLEPYAVFEVEHSSWIRQLERMNEVHPRHKPELFADCRHFVFAFHDSTLEVVADGFDVQVISGSMRLALTRMVEMIGGSD
jgi:hypothetical protein